MAEVVDLTELYEASYGRLVTQLYALCGDMTTAEDAVQDAFVTAIRKSRQLAHVHSPEAWIRTVAVNRLRAGWRHASVVRRLQPKVPGPQVPVEERPLDAGNVQRVERDRREDQRPVRADDVARDTDPEHVFLHAV